MTDIFRAIKALRPSSSFGVIGDRIKWNDTENSQPTEKEINDKIAELQADYDAKQYQRDRASEYPSITDVVVALAEKEEGNDAMWQEITAKRAKVKLDNPKPS